MSLGPGDLDAAILRGGTAPAPKMQRSLSAPLVLTTTFQRIDFATVALNEFPVITDAGLRLVDWDSVNKLITFNDQAAASHEYLVFLAIECTAAGVTSPPVLPALTVQVRYVVPNAGGVGVHYYFPNHGAASTREYLDFADILSDGTVVSQLPIHCPAGPAARLHGVGTEARLSAAPPGAATVSLDAAVMYLLAI